MQFKISERKAADIINSRNIKSRKINQNQEKNFQNEFFGIMNMNKIH